MTWKHEQMANGDAKVGGVTIGTLVSVATLLSVVLGGGYAVGRISNDVSNLNVLVREVADDLKNIETRTSDVEKELVARERSDADIQSLRGMLSAFVEDQGVLRRDVATMQAGMRQLDGMSNSAFQVWLAKFGRLNPDVKLPE